MVKGKLNRNGFTLVELVVAMALMSLVAVFGVSVTLIVTRAQRNFNLDAKSEADMVYLSSIFKTQIMQCDSDEYSLTVAENSVSFTKNGSEPTSDTEKMYFADGVFYYGELSNEFETVKRISFDCRDKLILCSVQLKETDYVYKITYNMRVATVAPAQAEPA